VTQSNKFKSSGPKIHSGKAVFVSTTHLFIFQEWLENCENAKKQLSLQMDQTDRASLIASADAFNNSTSTNTIEEEDETENESNAEARLKLNLVNMSDNERNKVIRELFSDFDILLAQRDFEKAVEMLLKIKQSTVARKPASSKPGNGSGDAQARRDQDWQAGSEQPDQVGHL